VALVESNVYGLWVAKQTARGNPANAAVKKLIQVGGDVDANRDDGSENWSDGTRFGDSTDFVNTLIGSGSPVIEAQPDTLAYLCYLFFGGEVAPVAAAGDPTVHTFVPGASTGFWSTWWQRVGLSSIVRQKFNDMRISSLRFEGSTGNKVVKVTPTLTGADPGEKYDTDPTPDVEKGTPGDVTDNLPFIYTEGKGAYTIDGTVFTGHSQFAVVVDDGLAPVYGDDVVPYEFSTGNAAVRLEGITLVLDDASKALYNKIIYDTATPAAGTKPIRTLAGVELGSYGIDLTRNGVGADALQRFKLDVAGVKWAPDLTVAPAPDGGPIELALAGQHRGVPGQPPVSVTVHNNDPAYA
jgi:hypothetical protein